MARPLPPCLSRWCRLSHGTRRFADLHILATLNLLEGSRTLQYCALPGPAAYKGFCHSDCSGSRRCPAEAQGSTAVPTLLSFRRCNSDSGYECGKLRFGCQSPFEPFPEDLFLTRDIPKLSGKKWNPDYRPIEDFFEPWAQQFASSEQQAGYGLVSQFDELTEPWMEGKFEALQTSCNTASGEEERYVIDMDAHLTPKISPCTYSHDSEYPEHDELWAYCHGNFRRGHQSDEISHPDHRGPEWFDFRSSTSSTSAGNVYHSMPRLFDAVRNEELPLHLNSRVSSTCTACISGLYHLFALSTKGQSLMSYPIQADPPPVSVSSQIVSNETSQYTPLAADEDMKKSDFVKAYWNQTVEDCQTKEARSLDIFDLHQFCRSNRIHQSRDPQFRSRFHSIPHSKTYQLHSNNVPSRIPRTRDDSFGGMPWTHSSPYRTPEISICHPCQEKAIVPRNRNIKTHTVKKSSEHPSSASFDCALTQVRTLAYAQHELQSSQDFKHVHVCSEQQEVPQEATAEGTTPFMPSQSAMCWSPNSIELVGFSATPPDDSHYRDSNPDLLPVCCPSSWTDSRVETMNLNSNMSCTDHLTAVRDAFIPPHLLLKSESISYDTAYSKDLTAIDTQQDQSWPPKCTVLLRRDDHLKLCQQHHTTSRGAVPVHNNTPSGSIADIRWSQFSAALEPRVVSQAQEAIIGKQACCVSRQRPRHQIGSLHPVPLHLTTCIGAVPAYHIISWRGVSDPDQLMSALQYPDDLQGAISDFDVSSQFLLVADYNLDGYYNDRWLGNDLELGAAFCSAPLGRHDSLHVQITKESCLQHCVRPDADLHGFFRATFSGQGHPLHRFTTSSGAVPNDNYRFSDCFNDSDDDIHILFDLCHTMTTYRYSSIGQTDKPVQPDDVDAFEETSHSHLLESAVIRPCTSPSARKWQHRSNELTTLTDIALSQILTDSSTSPSAFFWPFDSYQVQINIESCLVSLTDESSVNNAAGSFCSSVPLRTQLHHSAGRPVLSGLDNLTSPENRPCPQQCTTWSGAVPSDNRLFSGVYTICNDEILPIFDLHTHTVAQASLLRSPELMTTSSNNHDNRIAAGWTPLHDHRPLHFTTFSGAVPGDNHFYLSDKNCSNGNVVLPFDPCQTTPPESDSRVGCVDAPVALSRLDNLPIPIVNLPSYGSSDAVVDASLQEVYISLLRRSFEQQLPQVLYRNNDIAQPDPFLSFANMLQRISNGQNFRSFNGWSRAIYRGGHPAWGRCQIVHMDPNPPFNERCAAAMQDEGWLASCRRGLVVPP